MTNFEKYKEDLKKLTDNNCCIAIVNGVPCDCEEVCDCGFCDLVDYDDEMVGFLKWACKEYVEKPKLTKRELKFCELALTGWITRDKDGLFYFTHEPVKSTSTNTWRINGGFCVSLSRLFPDVKFDFIKGSEEKPWTIKELLKLEVIQDEKNK